MPSITATRRQREMFARERLILDSARRLLAEGGYHGLSMDRIAEAIEYSKGTVYQHFGSKEDLIAALCTDTAQARADMFRRAAAYPGSTRERVVAVGLADGLFVRRHPDHLAVESILDIGSVSEKITAERHSRGVSVKSAMMESWRSCVSDLTAWME